MESSQPPETLLEEIRAARQGRVAKTEPGTPSEAGPKGNDDSDSE